MANVDYKWAFESLVHTISMEQKLWKAESVHNWERSIEAFNSGNSAELNSAKSLELRYAGMADLCEYLLKMAAGFEGVPYQSYCQDRDTCSELC